MTQEEAIEMLKAGKEIVALEPMPYAWFVALRLALLNEGVHPLGRVVKGFEDNRTCVPETLDIRITAEELEEMQRVRDPRVVVSDVRLTCPRKGGSGHQWPKGTTIEAIMATLNRCGCQSRSRGVVLKKLRAKGAL